MGEEILFLPVRVTAFLRGSTPSGEGTASIIDEALTCLEGSCNGECKHAVTIGIKPKVYSTKEGR